jgi:hypothetical protein
MSVASQYSQILPHGGATSHRQRRGPAVAALSRLPPWCSRTRLSVAHPRVPCYRTERMTSFAGSGSPRASVVAPSLHHRPPRCLRRARQLSGTPRHRQTVGRLPRATSVHARCYTAPQLLPCPSTTGTGGARNSPRTVRTTGSRSALWKIGLRVLLSWECQIRSQVAPVQLLQDWLSRQGSSANAGGAHRVKALQE